ncbi:MAG: hypothetical protein IT307_01505 [Chloroflexi bacterium]|nr:hypothetical protein [Chloroflexota bacterium]
MTRAWIFFGRFAAVAVLIASIALATWAEAQAYVAAARQAAVARSFLTDSSDGNLDLPPLNIFEAF